MRFSPSSRSVAASSKQWLTRQFKDPYVKQRLSHPASYRSRSAFKLVEIDGKWGGFLSKPDVDVVVDLGAAPGGWSQVVAGKLGWSDLAEREPFVSVRPKKTMVGGDFETRDARRKSGSWSSGDEKDFDSDPLKDDPTPRMKQAGRGTIIALDLLRMQPIPGVVALQRDFLSADTSTLLQSMLTSASNPHGKADVVLSDMAANFSGNRTRDVESSLEICEAVFEFVSDHLRTAEEIGRRRGGVLLMKHFMHPLLHRFRKEKLEPAFHDVKFIKPDASRSGSSEGYWLCQGWRGASK